VADLKVRVETNDIPGFDQENFCHAKKVALKALEPIYSTWRFPVMIFLGKK